MTPYLVPISEFRANLASLYNRYLSPDSDEVRPIVVMDAKKGIELFEVRPVSNNEKDKKFTTYLNEITKDFGAKRLDVKAIKRARTMTDKRIRKRIKQTS